MTPPTSPAEAIQRPAGAAAWLARVLPVVRHALTLGVPVSVDTYKPEVMQAAIAAGTTAKTFGMRSLEVRVKGPGAGRESAIRALQTIEDKDRSPLR